MGHGPGHIARPGSMQPHHCAVAVLLHRPACACVEGSCSCGLQCAQPRKQGIWQRAAWVIAAGQGLLNALKICDHHLKPAAVALWPGEGLHKHQRVYALRLLLRTPALQLQVNSAIQLQQAVPGPLGQYSSALEGMGWLDLQKMHVSMEAVAKTPRPVLTEICKRQLQEGRVSHRLRANA